MMLVTVDFAKPHIQVDYDVSDELIEFQIHAASEAVLNYLKDARYDFTDTSGEVLTDSAGNDLTPFVVKQAVVMLVDEFFTHRGSDGGKAARWEMGYLPPNVMAVLYPLRDPAFA
jgi:Phage gp6-like head-tail connector protein